MAEGNQTTPFVWNAKRERAAILVAEDELPDHAIAKSVGVTKKTLETWKRHPEFAAQVGDHIGQLQASALKFPIAKKYKRLENLNRLWQKANAVIDLRAADYAADPDVEAKAIAAARRMFGNDVVPEAVTGLLVMKETPTTTGAIAVEWKVDVALMREIRALQEDAAKELGQLTDKREVTFPGISFADLFTLVSTNQGASSGGLGRDG